MDLGRRTSGDTSVVGLGLEMDLLEAQVAHGMGKRGTYLKDFINRDINWI